MAATDKPRLLIVEDEAVVAIDVRAHLERLGYEVVAVTDTGEDACRLAGELAPDLVLLDIQLRGAMDGIEAGAQIRRELALPVEVFVGLLDEVAHAPLALEFLQQFDRPIEAAVVLLLRGKCVLHGPLDLVRLQLLAPSAELALGAALSLRLGKLDAEAPHETLLVLDAGTGQNALAQADNFRQWVGVSGISLTKLDGTAKGGVIFAIARKLGLPIRFIGIGEQAEDLRPFVAEEFIEALFAGDDAAA